MIHKPSVAPILPCGPTVTRLRGGDTWRRLALIRYLVATLFAAGSFTVPPGAGASSVSRVAAPCLPGRSFNHGTVICVAPSQFPHIASGLPFSAADPHGVVTRLTHLPGIVMVVQRTADPPRDGATFPIGPPQSLATYFASSTSAWNTSGSSRRAATFVLVYEYQLSQTGKPRLRRISPNGQWVFTADIPRQRMTIEVESDGPKEVVGAIGHALMAVGNRLPVKPTAPERVYVTAPHALHAGTPATFWVLVAPRWGTYPAPAFDFDFTLGGSWSQPMTKTPDGSQACGGDNVAGQPARRGRRWVFKWGDCPELGLVLTPLGTGRHDLIISGYSVPITARGTLDFQHEKLAPGSGYQWRGTVLP